MAHVAVAMDARRCFALRIFGKHLVDHLGMAMEAGVLRHAGISRLDLNRLVKIFERERQRMKEAVVGLGDPMA